VDFKTGRTWSLADEALAVTEAWRAVGAQLLEAVGIVHEE
jgi:hypothetical protein